MMNDEDPFCKTSANLLIQNSKYLERDTLNKMVNDLKN